LGFGEEHGPLGQLAVHEAEGVAVLRVEAPSATVRGHATAGDEILVVGEHRQGLERDGPARLLPQPPQDLGEAVDATELTGDPAAARDPVHDVCPNVIADGCEVVAVEGVDGVQVGGHVGVKVGHGLESSGGWWQGSSTGA
jgi:hypothetical protein